MNRCSTFKTLCGAVYPLVSLAAAAAAALSIAASAHAGRADAAARPQEATMTPQATRAPELPVGCVV